MVRLANEALLLELSQVLPGILGRVTESAIGVDLRVADTRPVLDLFTQVIVVVNAGLRAEQTGALLEVLTTLGHIMNLAELIRDLDSLFVLDDGNIPLGLLENLDKSVANLKFLLCVVVILADIFHVFGENFHDLRVVDWQPESAPLHEALL